MDTTAIIRHLCSKEGISVTKLEEEMGYGNGSLTKGNVLKSDRLYELSKRFSVTMEYLLTGKSNNGYTITPFEYALILAYRKTNEGIQSAIDKLLDLENFKKETVSPSLQEA